MIKPDGMLDDLAREAKATIRFGEIVMPRRLPRSGTCRQADNALVTVPVQLRDFSILHQTIVFEVPSAERHVARLNLKRHLIRAWMR